MAIAAARKYAVNILCNVSQISTKYSRLTMPWYKAKRSTLGGGTKMDITLIVLLVISHMTSKAMIGISDFSPSDRDLRRFNWHQWNARISIFRA